MKFKDFITANSTTLKTFMSWENYDLNNTVLPVVDLVQDHALQVLANNFGKFEVEDDILDEVSADIFINFPPLLQQLSISRVMTSESVVQTDILSETMTRRETGQRDTNQTTDTTLGTEVSEINSLGTTQATTGNTTNTGTVNVGSDTHTNQSNETDITNSTDVEATGSRNVNLSHQMPEQALTGTGNFPVDAQGTPILTTSYVQSAGENFATVNPIETTESSTQVSTVTNDTESDSITTNNLASSQNVSVVNSGSNTRTLNNTGSDNVTNAGVENTENEITETIDREATNAQYAYEIKAFLESVQAINAFKTWTNNFAWVCGIL